MTIAESPLTSTRNVDRLPPLEAGDHLDQPTFHARYLAMPPGTRAELIGGVVYMPSQVGRAHGSRHKALLYVLARYERFTAGVESLDNSTAILADDSEPQPDASLRITVGGRTRETVDGDLAGCPELVCEVSNSTESYDLHAKRSDYERHGAVEYLAAVLRVPRVAWFVRQGERLVERQPDADGIYRSRAFPGLWIDAAGLLAGDLARLDVALEQGLATPEHAAFVADRRNRTAE